MGAAVLKASVIAIDDDADFLATLKHYLDMNFETVDTAMNEKDGRALLERNRYDLILLDLVIDGRPAGLRICRELKGDARWRDIGILIVSVADVEYGMGLKSYLGDEGCLPADDFIDKLIGPEEIAKRARRVVERAASGTEG